MSKIAIFAGIDVSAKTLAVAVQQADGEGMRQREFPNHAAGHKKLIVWLLQRGSQVRVSLEATGIYSLDVALALDEADGIELAVLNPKVVKRFAETVRRSKTDKADAEALAEYSLRMRFVAWKRPGRNALQLRAITRHIGTLVEEHTRCNNRLHASEGSVVTPRCVREDLKRTLARLEKRIAQLRREAMSVVHQDEELEKKFKHLVGIPGIAQISAVQLLSELAGLDPDMTVRQWVAYSGLDPVHQISGTSVHRRSRISRRGNVHLRRALYMPALVGVRWDPAMRAFYLALQARHKTKPQALVAVCRKILHAIFGIFKTGTPYDGTKLFPQLPL